MKISPVGTELFNEDERTDRHDGATIFKMLLKVLKVKGSPGKSVILQSINYVGGSHCNYSPRAP